ncbi:MAG: phosphotransferase [Woeseiaceae bacterium]
MNAVEQIRDSLVSVSGWDFASATFTELPGGVTNQTWLVESKPVSCVVRLNSTHAGIIDFDRKCELLAHGNAAEIDIAPEIIHYDNENGILITEYLPGRVWSEQDLLSTRNIETIAGILRRVHKLPACGTALDLASAATQYERHLQKREGLHAFALRCVEIVDNLSVESAKVCCHNDIVAANFVGDELPKLIDWEYAGDNDPFFDLASLIGYHGLQPEMAGILLSAYTGRQSSEDRESLDIQVRIYDAIQWLWLAVRQLDKPSKERFAMLEEIQQRIQ